MASILDHGVADKAKLAAILCCPRCKERLYEPNNASPNYALACCNSACALSRDGFPDIDGVPALVDFDNSIISRDQCVASRGSSYKPRRRQSLYQRLRAKLLREPNVQAQHFAKVFVTEALALHSNPTILVIGGGSIGSTRFLYEHPDITIVGSDIYCSPNTSIIADGHQLPLVNGSVHGVWIGAVLEHVLTPTDVVTEIHRVLVKNGVVFAESPFMQQVHEGPFDFTRFTLSGHRWLFRQFDEIESCVCTGPSTVLIWSIRYYVASIFGSYKIGTIAALMFFWLRLIRPFQKRKFVVDGASALMFLGRRSDHSLIPRDMVSYYSGAQ